jgi:hypothetical protein
MSMLEAFKELINPDVVLGIATFDKKLTVKEDGKDSKLKKLVMLMSVMTKV